MPRNRKAVAERKKHEAELDRKNAFGFNDPTPYAAVKRINQRHAKSVSTATTTVKHGV